jgi:hypothetical protein
VLLPLLSTLVAGMVIGRIADAIMGPKTYYVYLIGNKKRPNVTEILKAAAGDFNDQLGGVSIATEIVTDSGDPEQAATTARTLTARSDVLLDIARISQIDLSQFLLFRFTERAWHSILNWNSLPQNFPSVRHRPKTSRS